MKRFEKFVWALFFLVCGYELGTWGFDEWILLLMILALFALRTRLDVIKIARVLGELLLALRQRELGKSEPAGDADAMLEEEAARWTDGKLKREHVEAFVARVYGQEQKE